MEFVAKYISKHKITSKKGLNQFEILTKQAIVTILSFICHMLHVCFYLAFLYGWPRKNAMTLIVNFKDIINRTEFISVHGKFISQQNDTMIIYFG